MARICRLLSLSLLFSLFSGLASATVVRVDFVIGSQAPKPVYIELLDQGAPATVANFLNYVENGFGERRYDGTFVHRLATNFVLQLGGFEFDPAAGSFEGSGVTHIPEDAPVVNEFSVDRSNLRGTIAMAKLSNAPDSATSEWFFNLADNSANLDNQNGGFTVFGRVLGAGMATVDEIASLDTANASSPSLTAVPVTGYTPGDAISLANLVIVDQVIKDPDAAISTNTLNADFGQIEVGTGPGIEVITVQNIGATDLDIGTVADTDALSAPFSISSDTCSSQTLASLQTCTVSIEYGPTIPGTDQDSFNIPSTDTNLAQLTIALSGTGVSSTPFLQVTPSDSIELPTTLIGDTGSVDVLVKNIGGGQLQPEIPSITGADANAFNISQNDCFGVSLALNESCTITIELFGDNEGTRTASFQIDAAPGNQSFQAPLSGSVVPPAPNIDVDPQIIIPDTMVGETLSGGFGIRNIGVDRLKITNIEIIGSDAVLFDIGDTCLGEVQSGTGCRESLSFSPVATVESVDATIRIHSDDPDSPVTAIPVQATASSDEDGVTDAVENLGPNGGDGNGDGIADATQAHVTSLPNINGSYVTFETEASHTLATVNALENPSPTNSPQANGAASLQFSQGFFGFNVENISVGGSATVTIHLAGNSVANTYFKYGVSPSSPFLNHWYQFDYNGETGAEFLDDRIILHFVDGGRGDGDLTANGRIVDPGGPATFSTSGSSSGGGGGGCALGTIDTQNQLLPLRLDFIILVAALSILGLHRHIRVNFPARRN